MYDYLHMFLEFLKNEAVIRPEVFRKNIAQKNFAEFTEKHLFQILFFNKFTGLTP